MNHRYGQARKINRLSKGGSALLIVLCALTLPFAGCTMYPEKKTPTVSTTTSSEQLERIFWKLVHEKKWQDLQPLLAANVVWHVPDATGNRTLTRDQIQPYLAARTATDYTVRDVEIKPNGSDMTLIYTLEVGQPGGQTRQLHCVSVWQELPAPKDKNGTRNASTWLMIMHSEQLAS